MSEQIKTDFEYQTDQPVSKKRQHQHRYHQQKLIKKAVRRNKARHNSKKCNTNLQKKIAISPDGKEIYQLNQTGITVANQETNIQISFPLPNEFPQLSWGMDIAYDTTRNLISVVSLGGEGYLYRFDVKNRRWLDVRSVHNIDIESLTYHRQSDRYIALAKNYGVEPEKLIFISGTGRFLAETNINYPLTGFSQPHYSDHGKSPITKIKASHGNVVLMNCVDGLIKSVWYYNLAPEITQSTYQGQQNRQPILYSD